MKIVVAGGAGFLGSHLVDALISQGHEVIAVDNCYTGSKLNLQQHFGNPNFEFIRHDVTIPLFVECDFIFNLASPASPIQYQVDPVRTIETNVLGMINILKLAQLRSARVIQASTSEVYGDPLISPQSEEYWGNVNPIGVRSCYDEGKRAAETLCFDFLRQYGVDVRIVRIFNTYGPNMSLDDGRVVSNFITQSLQNLDISLYGDGSQSRSFCYVSDLIEGIIRLAFMSTNPLTPINLGNPNEILIYELARIIIKLTGSDSQIKFKDLPLDDPKQRKPNILKARKFLSWTPKVTLEEGLNSTISYFRNII